jgi:hypothetical protein
MLDRAEQLAECIAQDGPTFKIGGIPKSHPSLRDEIQCRAFVTRTLARLGAVGTDAKKRPPGRPPSAAVGITYEQLQRLQEDGDEIVP